MRSWGEIEGEIKREDADRVELDIERESALKEQPDIIKNWIAEYRLRVKDLTEDNQSLRAKIAHHRR